MGSKKKIQELKKEIYSSIDNIDDDKTALQMLEEAVAVYSNSSQKDILDDLTPDQKARLEESMQQADDQKTVLHDEVKKKAREWLSRSGGRKMP